MGREQRELQNVRIYLEGQKRKRKGGKSTPNHQEENEKKKEGVEFWRKPNEFRQALKRRVF